MPDVKDLVQSRYINIYNIMRYIYVLYIYMNFILGVPIVVPLVKSLTEAAQVTAEV